MARMARDCADAVDRGAGGAGPGQRDRRDREIPRRACRTAIRPNSGKRAAKPSGSRSATRRAFRWNDATSGSDRASSAARTRALPRYFADADRVQDLETRLVWCMVALQGIAEADADEGAVRRPRPEIRHGGARRLDHLRSARREDERRARAIRRKSEAYRLGEKMFYFRGGTARFRLRHLPRRGRQAHPAAGPAQPDPDRGRAEGVHDLAGLPRVAGRAAQRSSGG